MQEFVLDVPLSFSSPCRRELRFPTYFVEATEKGITEAQETNRFIFSRTYAKRGHSVYNLGRNCTPKRQLADTHDTAQTHSLCYSA